MWAALVVASAALVATGCSSGHAAHRAIAAAVVNGTAGYQPATVTVHTGDKVTMTVANTTDKAHGFDIDGLGVKAQVVEPGTPVTVKFRAKRPGTFRIFCQLHPQHQPATLVVL